MAIAPGTPVQPSHRTLMAGHYPSADARARHPRKGRRTTRVLTAALALSLAVHLAFTLWPASLPDEREDPPLQATITHLPPPPPQQAVASAEPKPRAKPKPRPRKVTPLPVPEPPTPRIAAFDTPAPDEDPLAAFGTVPAAPEAVAQAEAAAPEPAVVPIPEPAAETELPPPLPDVPDKVLPPRIELAYRVFYGTHGFYIGDATYRFEHADNRYRIATVGQARGLAALILRGEGRIESRGFITPTGLQPDEFTVERGKGRKREVADFDWEAGVVTLDEEKSAPLELPTYDPLAFLWQFYFLPPAASEETFAIATTKRVSKYLFRREGSDTIALPSGDVEAERWHRQSDDGKTDAYVWLAPSMHYVAVKLRFANTTRGTVEALLDGIRVDADAAQ